MLVLTRRLGEAIVIDGCVHVQVAAIQGDKVRLGIDAPEEIRVDRLEVHQRRAQFADAVPEADSMLVVPNRTESVAPGRPADLEGTCPSI